MPRYHVDRSIVINAPPEQVHATVADFGTWTTWSPWLCAEPDAEVTVSDDSNSVGSVYAWKGEVVGQGEMEHQRLEPGRLIDDEIRFVKPFKSVSRVSFLTEPADAGTRITWNMDGKLPIFLFWMKPMMQRFIGMDYERGLKMLKEWIETGQVLSSTEVCGVEATGPLQVIGLRTACSFASIGQSMESTFRQIDDLFQQHGLPTDCDMVSVYHETNFKQQTFDYTGGRIVPNGTEAPAGLSTWSLPACQALKLKHTGAWHHLGNAWSAAAQHIRARKLKESKAGAFEIYRNNPPETDEADLKTELYLPLR